MKIVVTGGNGNIGTHIIRELLKQGTHTIYCFDCSERSTHPDCVQYIRGDRHNKEEYIRVMQEIRPDVAFELTSFSADDAEVSIRAFDGISQFIVASTVCTYGKDFRHLPVKEDDEFSPSAEYGMNKDKADKIYMKAYEKNGFPVTIMKPCTSYSEMSGMLRSLTTEFTWIDRVKKGKPILICNDGQIIHQLMHTEDTARGFVGVMGKPHCIGQIYNVVQSGYTTWAEYHQTALKVLNSTSELVSISLTDLMAIDPKRFSLCYEIFGQHTYISNEKLRRDVPEWEPRITLEEGMSRVFRAMEESKRIPDSDSETWEDEIINAIKKGRALLPVWK